MSRILVTGGAGFIGSHLCERLLSQGHEVLCLDNFFTGRRENVKKLLANNSFELIRHDIIEPILLEVDQIYHLACPASPVHYQYNPVKTIKTNVMGTINMLGLAKRVGGKFLLASTSEVYGDPLLNPQPETYWGNVNPIGARGVYDEAKRFAEAMTMAYHRYHGVDTRIVRIFNTYGPRMRPKDGRVVSNFIVQALQGKPLTVFGDGSQTRSFCYVDDLVRGIVALLMVKSDKSLAERTDRTKFLTQKPDAIFDSIHDPVNIGNPRELTVRGIAEIILKLTGSKSVIEERPLPADDPKVRRPDITRAKSLLGWEPKVELEDGIRKATEYFRQVVVK